MKVTRLCVVMSLAALGAFASEASAQMQVGNTGGGFGGGSQLGGGSPFGSNTSAAAGGAGPASQKLPGSFGGAGITGVAQVEYSTVNALKGFSSPNAGVAGGMSGGAGGVGGSSAGGLLGGGGSPFGTNAFGGTGLGGGLGGNTLGGGLGGLGGLGAGGLGGVGGLGGLGGNRNRLGGTGGSSNQKNKLRTMVRPEIEVARPSGSQVSTNIQTRLSRLRIPDRMKSVDVNVEDGFVVLRGEVATEADKRFVERLVKLEPGVDHVRNEVTVTTNSLERIPARPSR